MFIFRVIILVSAVVGTVYLWDDWESLPDTYPRYLDGMPVGMFNGMTLVAIILALLYISAEYRNVRRQLKFRWLNPTQASHYFRSRMDFEGLSDAAQAMDVVHESTSRANFSDTAMAWLADGVNDGVISMRGRQENTADIRRIPGPLDEHWVSGLQDEPSSHGCRSADGRIYRDLEFNRSSIKKWVKKLAIHKKKSLKAARDSGSVDDFIKEHEADPEGDLDKIDEVIKRSTRETGKATRPASSRDASDD